MRLFSLRLIVSLIVAITLVSVLSVYNEVRRERRSLRGELQGRAADLADSLAGNVQPNLDTRSSKKLKPIVERFSNREHLAGIAVFDEKLQLLAQSDGLPDRVQGQTAVIMQAIASQQRQSAFVNANGQSLYVYAVPLNQEDYENSGVLVIVHDA